MPIQLSADLMESCLLYCILLSFYTFNHPQYSQMSVSKECYSRVSVQFSSVQSLSRVQLSATPCITAHQSSLSITNSRSSLRLTSIESVMPSSQLILCCPLLLLPPIPPSYYSDIKKNEIMPLEATWVDLEMTKLSESEKDRSLMNRIF